MSFGCWISSNVWQAAHPLSADHRRQEFATAGKATRWRPQPSTSAGSGCGEQQRLTRSLTTWHLAERSIRIWLCQFQVSEIQIKREVGQTTMSLIPQIFVVVDDGGIETPVALQTPALRTMASRWRCCAILTMSNCHLSASDCCRPRALTPGPDNMRGSQGCAPCLDATGPCLRLRNRLAEAAYG